MIEQLLRFVDCIVRYFLCLDSPNSIVALRCALFSKEAPFLEKKKKKKNK